MEDQDLGLDPELTTLLDGHRDDALDPPPPGAKGRVYGRVAATLGLSALGGAVAVAAARATPVAAPAAAAVVTLAKSGAPRLLLASVVGAVLGGGAIFLGTRPPAPPVAAPAVAPLIAPAPVVEAARPPSSPVITPPALVPEIAPSLEGKLDEVAPAVAQRPRVRLASRPRLAVTAAPMVVAVPEKGLAAEHALLEKSRAALALGDPAGALAVISAHADQFPAGQLLDERESLAVRALAAAGRSDEARARGAAFRRRFPGSIHLAAVDATIAGLR